MAARMKSVYARFTGHAGLVVTLVLAACGGAAATSKPVETPAGAATAPAATAAATAAPVGNTPATPATGTAPVSFGRNKPVVASALLAKLIEGGLDPKNLPELTKLGPAELNKVMTSFKKSLGVECNFCHTANFAADHPMKNVARKMWNENVRGITFDGGALYCDSCHQGKAQFLDKSDKKMLASWMDVEYTKRMKRNGQAQICATCHGEPFNPDFIESWKKK
jgi:hypothetical protein